MLICFSNIILLLSPSFTLVPLPLHPPFLISSFLSLSFHHYLSYIPSSILLSTPPADAFLKAAVSLLPEVPRSISVEGKLRSSESFLMDFINNFLAMLLVVPVTQSFPQPFRTER